MIEFNIDNLDEMKDQSLLEICGLLCHPLHTIVSVLRIDNQHWTLTPAPELAYYRDDKLQWSMAGKERILDYAERLDAAIWRAYYAHDTEHRRMYHVINHWLTYWLKGKVML